VALSTWRDEAKGLMNGMEPQPDADMAAASDDDDDGDMHPPRDVPVASSRATSPFRAASRGPPTSGSEPEDEWDVDAAIREEEELERTRTKAPPALTGDMDMDDEAFWEEPVPQQKTSAPAPAPVSDDDLWAEMDDAMMDMDETVSLTAPTATAAAKPQQAAAADDDDWDDLYA
jgi:replication fork protection complex subunit Csm3/Swi3